MSTKGKIYRLFCLAVLSLSLIKGVDHAYGGIGSWPSSIDRTDGADGRNAFSIKGLYGNEDKWKKWNKNGNWLMRKLKKFSESDSLAVDLETKVAWFYTEKTLEEFIGLLGPISTFSGFVPTFSELMARDWESPNFDPDYFEKFDQYEIEGVGDLINVQGGTDETCLRLRFIQKSYNAFKSNAVFELSVSGALGGQVEFAVSQVDSIPYSALSAFSSYSTPDFAEGKFALNEMGFAKLNETREHCKGHMEHALRVYNKSGQYFWKTELGLQGARGIWARDLDNDGIGELLVLADDHGKRRLIIFRIAY